jgi:hypothetical protein
VPVVAEPTEADDVASTTLRVHALLDDGRWREALGEARASVERNADDPQARSLLGEALYRAGRFDEVEAVLEGLEDLPGPPGRGLMTLGRLRDAQGRGDEAIRLMKRAVEAAPHDRDVLYHAAGATASRGEAVALLERYLQVSEGDDEETIEAAKGHVKLFRALGERPIWVSKCRPDRLELPLKPLWVPETGQVVGYLVQVRLGEKGKPVWLLLDSGSPGLFVIERIARKRGFAPLAEVTVFGGGGDGKHATRRGFFSSFAAGDLEFSDALASVAKQEIDPQGRFHGLVGLSIFGGYVVTLDLDGNRMMLDREGGGAEGVTYYTVGGQMLVRAETTHARSGMFLFDTGSTSTLVADSLLEDVDSAKVGGPVQLPAYGGLRRGSRTLDGIGVLFQGVSTGDRELRAIDLSLRSQVGGVEISGFLGLDLLDGKKVVIDTRRRTVAVN